MWIAPLLIGYCVLIAAASVTGGWLPALVRMTHLRTQLLMSFVAGLMLGIAMLHLLPHAVDSLGSAAWTGSSALAGTVFMFLLLRAFHVHHHGDAPLAIDPESTLAAPASGSLETASSESAVHSCGNPDEACRGGDHHTTEAAHSQAPRPLGWVGLVCGLGLHTLMDGVALGASVTVDASHGAWLGLAGLGTFLAIALHKPLDAFAITSVMQTDGWSSGQRSAVNLLFALACPAGALFFWLGATRLDPSGLMLGIGLGISAGFFVCIALSDLLPEVHFHHHDRLALTTALLVGVALAVGIENLPGHSHTHSHVPNHNHSRNTAQAHPAPRLHPDVRVRPNVIVPPEDSPLRDRAATSPATANTASR